MTLDSGPVKACRSPRNMPDLAVIVPTYNERSNVSLLVDALHTALAGIDFEVIFVDDDSPDGTADEVRSLSRTDPRVRIIHRINRRGLSSAAVEGMMASSADYLAVMDGDLQHDEGILPEMLRKLKEDNLELVVGTRYAAGGSVGELDSSRQTISGFGKMLSTWFCGVSLSDPMSGYFLVTRQFFHEVVPYLSSVGFKILIDLVASAGRPVRLAEVGYTFRTRMHGESKLNLIIALEFLELLLDKKFGDWVPARFLMFGLVGLVGVLAQLSLIMLALYFTPLELQQAQLYSSLGVILLNFTLNNRLTFRSQRLLGWKWPVGLFLFFVACSAGLYTNLQVAESLRLSGKNWVPASAAGITVGWVWNYSVSGLLVWRLNTRKVRK